MGHDNSHDDVSSHVKTYLKIGVTLIVFTVITVAISFIDFGGNNNMIVGMAVATFKASLVCLIFMHLNHERPLIYKVLVFTVVLAIVLFTLFISAHGDPLKDEGFEAPAVPVKTATAHH
ncbi:MAG: cytochrome C oxidase subunit IV family protein [Verrucomicrobiaceae bacterium]|nr:cytochrome C oxidase subunit IV family protein [Verrucomicrobiaceae bacterium]